MVTWHVWKKMLNVYWPLFSYTAGHYGRKENLWHEEKEKNIIVKNVVYYYLQIQSWRKTKMNRFIHCPISLLEQFYHNRFFFFFFYLFYIICFDFKIRSYYIFYSLANKKCERVQIQEKAQTAPWCLKDSGIPKFGNWGIFPLSEQGGKSEMLGAELADSVSWWAINHGPLCSRSHLKTAVICGHCC